MRVSGFTLVELTVALALIGILLLVALPGYQQSRLRSVQTQGMATLLSLAQAQERLRLSLGHYQASAGLTAATPLPRQVAAHYRLVVEVSQQGRAYLMRLIPRAGQDSDAELSLDHVGRRLPAAIWF